MIMIGLCLSHALCLRPLTQVLRRHPSDHLGQRPGDELGAGGALPGALLCCSPRFAEITFEHTNDFRSRKFPVRLTAEQAG